MTPSPRRHLLLLHLRAHLPCLSSPLPPTWLSPPSPPSSTPPSCPSPVAPLLLPLLNEVNKGVICPHWSLSFIDLFSWKKEEGDKDVEHYVFELLKISAMTVKVERCWSFLQLLDGGR